MEVTTSPEPSRQRAARRSGDQAGRNASERRAGLETINVGADPPLTRGRPPLLANRETGGIGRPKSDLTQRSHRGNDDGMSGWGDSRQHGKPQVARARDPQPDAREGQAGPPRVAERLVVPPTPGNSGGTKGSGTNGTSLSKSPCHLMSYAKI
jgi:hypothetical protein